MWFLEDDVNLLASPLSESGTTPAMKDGKEDKGVKPLSNELHRS